jgi:hypothetical protein
MATPFAFTTASQGDVEQRNAYVFTGQYALNEGLLALKISGIAASPQVANVTLIAPMFLKAQLIEVSISEAFYERLPERLRDASKVSFIVIDEKGVAHSLNGETLSIVDPALTQDLRIAGLRTIFGTREPILEGVPKYHFQKPSGQHSDKFIRVADILVDAVEIEFIALWLLPQLGPDIQAVFCDTLSINSIAYAALHLDSRFSSRARAVEVNTFNSYEFIQNDSCRVRADALYIISTTTSGQLERAMVKKGVAPEHIATLYAMGDRKPLSSVLCDLSVADGAEWKPPEISSYNKDSCPLCRARVPVVQFSNGHFFPLETNVDTVVPVAEDAPPWLFAAMRQYAGKKIFACHSGSGDLGNIRELHVDVSKLLKDDSNFLEEVVKHLKLAVAAPLNQIFYLDDPASRELAELVGNKCQEWMARAVPTHLFTPETAKQCKDGSVLVVGSAACTGRTLLSIGQQLRDLCPSGSVVFFIAVLRTQTELAAKRLQSNLTFTPNRNYRYGFHAVERFCLPDNTRQEPSVWSEELTWIKKLILESKPAQASLVQFLESRRKELESAPNAGGLIENVFWPKSDLRSPLTLRSNFSLFDFKYRESDISQADVFCSIAVLLHRMRTDSSVKVRLTQSPFNRSILDRETFARFSDGVVQASILRSAHPAELDYRLKEGLSATMAGLIDRLLTESESPEGEACMEFLVALGLGRLQLKLSDLEQVLPKHANYSGEPTMKSYLCKSVWDSLSSRTD